MTDSVNNTVRSFLLCIYGPDLQELTRYQLPVSVVAPFTNRLFDTMLSDPSWRTSLREPSYLLSPRKLPDFAHAPAPEGPTSLAGAPYDPSSALEPQIRMHPGAFVRSFLVKLMDINDELYRGEYAVDDIFLDGAHFLLHHKLLKRLTELQGPFYYAVLPSTVALYSVSSDLLPDEAYQVEGVFRLPPRVGGDKRIQFRKVAEPPLDVCSEGAFGPTVRVGKGEPQAGEVFMHRSVYCQLISTLELSTTFEEAATSWGKPFGSRTAHPAKGIPPSDGSWTSRTSFRPKTRWGAL